MSFWTEALTATVGLLGGIDAGNKDREAGEEGAERSREAIESGKRDAKATINALAPRIEDTRMGGYQNAQDIMKSAVPQQLEAFQQGNTRAQETSASTVQQMRNARMGLPTDLGFLQPKEQYAANFDFLNTDLTLPDRVETPGQAEEAEQQEILDQSDSTVFDIYAQYLGREPDPSGMNYFRNMVTDDQGRTYPAGIKERWQTRCPAPVQRPEQRRSGIQQVRAPAAWPPARSGP